MDPSRFRPSIIVLRRSRVRSALGNFQLKVEKNCIHQSFGEPATQQAEENEANAIYEDITGLLRQHLLTVGIQLETS